MSLPKLRIPEYFTTLPTLKQEVKYRPWLVGEQKILLTAIESENNKEVFNAIYRIIDSCILSEGIDVNKLPSPDMEWLFIKMREASVGSIIDLKTAHKEGEQAFEIDIRIDLAQTKITDVTVSPNIVLEPDTGVGITLQYPTLEMMRQMSEESDTENSSQTDTTFKVIEKCIVSVFDENEVYNDLTSEYIKEFVESFNETQRKDVMDFFKEVPTVYLDITYPNPVTGQPVQKRLVGITDFFM